MNEPAIMSANKYGYRLNLKNHQIRRLYDRYKNSKGLPYFMAISEQQRTEFEEAILSEYGKLYQQRYGEIFNYPGHDYQRQLMNELINRVTLSRKED